MRYNRTTPRSPEAQPAGFGTSDVLCGVPGVSTLSVQAKGAKLTGDAFDRFEGALVRIAMAVSGIAGQLTLTEDSSLENR